MPSESFSKKMREQSIKPDPSGTATLIGLYADSTAETVQSDLEHMIKNNLKEQMRGYVLCLSRYLNHNKIFPAIQNAFSNQSKTVPDDYFKLFNRNLSGSQ